MSTKEKRPQPKTDSKRRRPVSQAQRSPSGQQKKRPSQTAQTRASVPQPRRSAPVRRRTPKKPGPEVVYTQPKPFHAGRFLLRLLTALAVVLALAFGMSIFFKVNTITVSGAEKYTPWEVRAASGIQEGESLLTLNDARISGKIIAQLPYVKSARIGIKLPDTVNIEIVELDVVYAVEASDGSWWLMTADGRIVERTNPASAGAYTKILGFRLENPAVEAVAVAADAAPAATTEDGESVPVTVRGGEQLSAALTILQYLEDNGIIGGAASVDVARINAIEIWYGQQYQVQLGDASRLGYKIKCLKQAIDQMGPYESGILDCSFTTWPNEVAYNPFP